MVMVMVMVVVVMVVVKWMWKFLCTSILAVGCCWSSVL